MKKYLPFPKADGPQHLPENLKRLRREVCLTQSEFAAAVYPPLTRREVAQFESYDWAFEDAYLKRVVRSIERSFEIAPGALFRHPSNYEVEV